MECEPVAEMLSFLNILLYYRETHWYQTVVYVDEPFSVPKGAPLTGSVALSPREENDRYDEQNTNVSRKPQYKDVYRRTIEILSHAHILRLIAV